MLLERSYGMVLWPKSCYDVVKEFFASADKNGDGMASQSEWNAIPLYKIN